MMCTRWRVNHFVIVSLIMTQAIAGLHVNGFALPLPTMSISVEGVTSSQLIPIVFVAHDAGESLMVRPIVDRLLKTGGTSANVAVIPLGEPAKTLFAAYVDSGVVITLPELGVNTTVIDGDGGRNQTLSGSDMSTLLKSIHAKFGKTLVTGCGMVYDMQAEIAGALHSSGSYVVGLDDSFSLWSNSSIPALEFVATDNISEIFVTAREIAHAVLQAPHAGTTTLVATIVGSPTLDEWADIVADTRTEILVREKVFGHDVSASDICVVYAGGYGGDDYIASLKNFCDTVKVLIKHVQVPLNDTRSPAEVFSNHTPSNAKSSPSFRTVFSNDTSASFRFAFSPHPGYSPTYEYGLFMSWGCGDVISIIDTAMNVSTGEAVAASNASLSQCSTVGGQSVSIGVPHAFVDPTNTLPHCADVFTVTALIPVTHTIIELVHTLNNTFRREGYRINASALDEAGVPRHGTLIAFNRLVLLANTTRNRG